MAVAKDESFPRATRIVHNVMALAVLVQLISQLFMHPPRPNHEPDFWFFVHQFSGMTAMIFVLAFWFLIFSHRLEKPFMAFFPYFSKDGRASLWQDTKRFFRAAIKFKLPPYDGNSEFATAIEGLGLLLITYMGATGIFYGVAYNVFELDFRQLHEVGEFHEAFGFFVWLYVLGHAGMGILHQVTQGVRLARMWSFGK